MNRKHPALHLLALASLSALCATSAIAQDHNYYYGGLSAGPTRGKFNEEGISNILLQGNATPVSLTGLTLDQRDNAYRVFGGYQFNRNFGLELGFFNLGKYHFQSTTSPAGVLNGEMKVQGVSLDAVAALPLGDRFSLLGRVGAQYAKTRNSFNGSGAVAISNPSPSDRQLNYKVGAGMQYAFNPNLLMRLEAEQYRVRDALGGHARVQALMVSLVVPFGAGATSSRSAGMPAAYKPVAYVTPAPAAPMAAPLPMPAPDPVISAAPVVAPVAVAASRRVSFAADTLFAFDQSALRPDGKTALDTFAREVAGTRFEVIVVEGHTDRIGSTGYNQTLSMQRAEAVKAYLVSSGGFDASKVSATGLGETAATQAGDCRASLPTAELRACLQPDRRVDVDVTGTR
jgi:OOP family OmpA-OmpF porin